MHICFITNEYPKEGFPHGGVGSFVKTISQQFLKNGFTVSVIGINYMPKNEYIVEEGVHVYRIRSSKIKGLIWLKNSIKINEKIKQIHKINPITIIETAELGLSFINKIKSIKYIIRLHGGHHFFAESENRKINKWKGFQEKRSFKKADAFIAVSNYVKIHTEKYLSYNSKKIELIRNPINTDMFAPINSKISENKIVFVGTVCEKKGIRQLIQAFPIVKNEFPKATLDIYGGDWYFPDKSSYIKKLQDTEFIKLKNISNSICFKGVTPNDQIKYSYANAEVCVFPSHMETQGLVAPEAMSMQKLVIFTNLGPGPEIITNNETGLLCNPHDPKDIAEKILWVFKNKEKSNEIAKKARNLVCKNYNLATITQQNTDFYKSII